MTSKALIKEINEKPCTESYIDKERTEKLQLSHHEISLKRVDSKKAISDSTTYLYDHDCFSTTSNCKKNIDEEYIILQRKNESNHIPNNTKLTFQSNVRHGRKCVEKRPRMKTLWKFSKIVLLSVMFSSADERCSGYVYRTAAVGLHFSIDCDIKAKPNLRTSSVENGVLDIQHVKRKDAGVYNCGKYMVKLEVTALVPYFQQTPLSYIKLRPENNRHLVIEMSIQPHLVDGLILYIANNIDESPVVTIGLQGAQPVMYIFKGNVSTAIKGNQLLSLNKWHTIYLKVERKTATMVIDHFPPYVRTLIEDIDLSDCYMYIGAFRLNISGYSAGFVGFISQFKQNDQLVDLGSEALDLVGIDHYNACAENPCKHEKDCLPANVKEGFVCICPKNDTDTNCQIAQKECAQIMLANLGGNVVITWKTTDRHITYLKINDEDIATCTPLYNSASLESKDDFSLYNVSSCNDTCQLDIKYPVLNEAFGDIKIEIDSSTAGLENVFINESMAFCMTSSVAIVVILGDDGYAPNSNFSIFETQLQYYSLVIGISVAVVFLLAAGILIMFRLRVVSGNERVVENIPLFHPIGIEQGAVARLVEHFEQQGQN